MSSYTRDEVIAIADNGLFHLHCYDGNLNNLEEHHIVTENDIDEEDFDFCDKCGIKI